MDKRKANIQSMFSEIAKFYDRGNSVLSLGLHFLWKKSLVKEVCHYKPQKVLDLCCGTGDIHLSLLEKSINSIAVDFTLPMLKILSNRQEKQFPTKALKTVAADALNLPFRDNSFSCVTVSYGVRNFESLEEGLKEVLRVLEPDGKLFVLEFGQAPQGVMGNLVKFYESKMVPLIGKMIFSSSKAYSYLSQSAESFPSQNDFLEIAHKVGYTGGKFRSLCFGASYLYELSKGKA